MISLTAEETANIATIDAFIAAWNAKDNATAGAMARNEALRASKYLGRAL